MAYRDANQYPTSSSGGGPLKTHQTFVDGKQAPYPYPYPYLTMATCHPPYRCWPLESSLL